MNKNSHDTPPIGQLSRTGKPPSPPPLVAADELSASGKLLNDPANLSHRRRLTVFGGSFNPIHNGHLFLAGELLRRRLADEVIFVPARTPPHKPSEQLLRGELRYELVQLAIDPYPQFSVSDIELASDQKTGYTIETLSMLSRAFTDADISFLVGMDSLRELPTWFQAAQLVGRFSIISFPRPDVAIPTHADLAGHFGPRLASRLLAGVVDCHGLPISATAIRELAAAGKSLAGLVPPTIEHAIRTRNLFQIRPEGAME